MKGYKLLSLFLLLFLLSACSSQDMVIVDQNGKTIDIASDGHDTYTFALPQKQDLPSSTWENPFHDVHEGDWFYNAVRYCYENRLMHGTTETTFSPEQSTSRGMIVSTLWRLDGSPQIGTATFTDVPADAYYSDAIAWAATEGIVSGYDAAHFAPNEAISREELAAILYRFAAYHHWDTTADTALTHFADLGTASDYAIDALSWAASHNIINGMEDHLLTPYGNATRAQVAAILMNLCESFAL